MQFHQVLNVFIGHDFALIDMCWVRQEVVKCGGPAVAKPLQMLICTEHVLPRHLNILMTEDEHLAAFTEGVICQTQYLKSRLLVLPGDSIC